MKVGSKSRLLFVVTEDWYFYLHRLDLARAASNAGFEVSVATAVSQHGERIITEGFRLLPVPFTRGMWRPNRDLATLLTLIQIYRAERPDIVHHVALKPILYGSLAARLTGVPAVINTIAGLGYIFTNGTWKKRVLRSFAEAALRWCLRPPASRVIFQNPDDRDELLRDGVVQQGNCRIIRGSGVDPSRFTPRAEPDGPPVILMASRMLWEKGVGEFVEAARLLKATEIPARFVLAGMVDSQNPSGIPESQLWAWDREGVIEFWGFRGDMPDLIAAAHIVVLPTSYGEGLPKILLEAGSCAKPIVATNSRGCREIVRHEQNGLLVPPHDAKALADAIELLVRNPSMRARMGKCGRELVLKEFSMERVANETLAVYRELLEQQRSMRMQDQELSNAKQVKEAL